MEQLAVFEPNNQMLLSSVEVSEMIGKRHNHLLRDIDGYVEILKNPIETKIGLNEKDAELNFELNDFFVESSYKDSIGRTLPCYLLTKKGCEMVANKMTGKKGVLFTAAYVTKFELMENQLKKNEIKVAPALKEAFEMHLLGMEYSARILRCDQASKIKMLEVVHKEHGVSTKHLPAYVDEEVTQSLSQLRKEHDIKLGSAKINTKLIGLGILEIKERPSSKGGMKEFKSLTDKGLEFGKNLISPNNPKETQPHYYPSKFLNLMELLEMEGVNY